MPGKPGQPDPLGDVVALATSSPKFLKVLIDNPEIARERFHLSDEDVARLKKALAPRLGDQPPPGWDVGAAAPWRFHWGDAPWRFFDPNK